MKGPPDVAAFLARVAVALSSGGVRFTWKAQDEIAELGWSDADALGELSALRAADLLRTESSRASNATLIWVFCPFIADLDGHLWIRLSEDAHGNLVISFHIAERNPWP